MWAKTFAVLMTSLSLATTATVVGENAGDEDPREFGYIGSQTIDLTCCLFYPPPDPPPPVCDGTDGILGSGVHGIGEGRFCGIQKGRAVWVSLTDYVMEDPQGSVYCPTDELPYQVFGIETPYMVRSHQKIGETGSHIPIVIPPSCMSTQNGDNTDLLVRLKVGSAVAGIATLGFNAS